MPFAVLPHTADFKLRVWGKNPEEVFQAALLAMSKILSEESPSKARVITRTVKLKAGDRTALLVDFLSEALALAQINREIYREVVFTKLTEQELAAELRGFSVEKFIKDIKAVTYHEAQVRQNPAGEWETFLVFDI